MIELLKNFDTQLFLFLNGLHNPFCDHLMYWISTKLIWIPFYLLILYYLIVKFRKETILILLFIAILITLSDQISTTVFKEMFHRFRPSHEPSIKDLVHIVNEKYGGDFGFVSSHAANTFALAMFLVLLIGKNHRSFTPVLIIWACVVSYSRIYLGLHYPGDILGGAILGALLAFLVFGLYKYLLKIKDKGWKL